MRTQHHAHRYGQVFLDYVDSLSGRSAAAFLSRLDLGFEPASILDVGCGRGVWLETWKRRGAVAVLGLDGAYVDPATLKLAPGEFRAIDLAIPFDLERRFDLVQCLEVAEHLPPSSADPLVASLVRHGDVVLFSAAPPGQGGEHHMNEQPLAYWGSKFSAHGFAAFDCVRPRMQGVRDIAPWYRYNAVVFANEAGATGLSAAARATRVAGAISFEEYASPSWRLRCALLRRTPRVVIEVLARMRHVAQACLERVGLERRDDASGSRLSPALLPVLVFLLLHAVRPFVMGLYHDDWSLFRVSDLIPASEYATFFSTEFKDRPVLGLVVRAINDLWGGEPWQLTLMASGFVAGAAISLYALLARISGLVERDRVAAAVGTAAWIALPWGLGYSLWPIGATTLVALASFFVSSTLAIDFMERGGAGRLVMAAALLAASFLSYQSCYLGFVPVVLLALALRPPDPAFRRRAGVALTAGLCVQVLALLQSLSTTSKSTSLDAMLIVDNIVSALPKAVAAPFGRVWVVPAAIVLVLVLSVIRNGRSVDEGRRRITRLALLACAAGIAIGTLPYSMAGYVIQGIGVFSRTTVSASVWACVLLAVAIMATRGWARDRRRWFLGWSGLLLVTLMVASGWQMTGWAESWKRQNEILADIPVGAISRLPKDAAVLLDEPMSIRGVEVFAAPWDIASAVYSMPAMRGIPRSERATITPIYRDVTMTWDGEELTLRPGWQIKATQLWVYRPSERVLHRIMLAPAR